MTARKLKCRLTLSLYEAARYMGVNEADMRRALLERMMPLRQIPVWRLDSNRSRIVDIAIRYGSGTHDWEAEEDMRRRMSEAASKWIRTTL